MTPEERAAKCYHELWEGNGTHSVEFVIAGIARAIREAQEEAVIHADAYCRCGDVGYGDKLNRCLTCGPSSTLTK